MDDRPVSIKSYCPLISAADGYVPCLREKCAWWGPVRPYANPAYRDWKVRPDKSGWMKVQTPNPPVLFVEGCRKIKGEVR